MTDMNTPAEASTPAPENEAVPAQAAEAPASTPVEAPAAPEQVAEEAPKSEFPAKYKNADGTPNYEKLAKAYTHLEKKLGTKPFVPAASVDEYEWTQAEDAPALDPEKLAEFKATVLEKGFTKSQFEFVMESHQNVIKAMVDSIGWSPDRSESALKETWGKDFDQNLGKAKATFDAFAPSDADPHDPVWNHPAVLKLLSNMGAELGEDSLARVPASSGGAGSVQSQIDAVRASPDYYTPAKQALIQSLYEKLLK